MSLKLLNAPSKLILALVPLYLFGCGVQKPQHHSVRHMPKNFVPGSFVVEVKDGEKTSGEQVTELSSVSKKLAADHGCQVSEPQRVRWENKSGVIPQDLYNTYHLRFDNCTLDAQATNEILSGIASSAVVNTVEAEAEAELFDVQANDPMLGQQYYLKNIKRDEACKLLPKTNAKPIVVAVIDSGVDAKHPDLQASFYKDSSGRVIGANFVDKGADAEPDQNWDDLNGHGTHVAGLIAATANNSQGIAGVAACANVKIMPVRVMNEKGRGKTMEIDRGIRWAAENGADIINLSLGSHAMSEKKGEDFRKALYESVAKQGVVVFAAAGNESLVNGTKTEEGYEYAFPASYSHVIAVAATDESDKITDFSNRGEKIDIAAPGANMASTYKGQSYKSLNGTSMATPVAVATYAIAYSGVIDTLGHRLNHDQVMAVMGKSVTRSDALPRTEVESGGVIDAAAITAEVLAKFGGEGASAVETINDGPDNDPAVNVTEMEFAGLSDFQKLNGSVRLELGNIPQGAVYLNLYWIGAGETKLPFVSMKVEGLTSVTTEDLYYFIGNKTLYAEAVDATGKQVGAARVELRGF